MTQCPQCNTQLPDTATQCYNCGKQLKEIENRFLNQIDIQNNTNMKTVASLGKYTVYEHQQDLSCDGNCIDAYFEKEMNVKKRQLLIRLDNNGAKVQSGAMQWMFGDVVSETGLGSGVKAVGNLIKGAVASIVTSETAVKPIYKGVGLVMLEPTFKNIILEDVASWGEKGVVLDDGIFLTCDAQLKEKVVVSGKNISSLVGGKGLFNLCLQGTGVAALESPVPRQELIEFELHNDTLKIDGSMAVMWSKSLDFTVERSSKTLIGSMFNKEGLVNVYRGTGKVLMAPTIARTLMNEGINTPAKASKGIMDKFQTSLSN